MDGNENNCPNCKQTISGDEQIYKCDLCIRGIHKACANLSASEIKCMPLQKRLLILLCNDCKMMLGKTPLMLQLLEEMRSEVNGLKNQVKELKLEITSARNSGKAYSDVLRSNNENLQTEHKFQSPSLIIKPKNKQGSEKTKKDLTNNIQPNILNIGIKQIRETKQGCIVIKCREKSDIDKLKHAAEGCLSHNYDVEVPKLNLPKMKIIGYCGQQKESELEATIRQQNLWIDKSDKFSITYIKRAKNKDVSTVFFECSPKLYWKMINQKKVFIGWQRCSVYENLSISRCFKCQDYFHKSTDCNNAITCGYCAGSHDGSECAQQVKKCKNCMNANGRFKLTNDTNHTAFDLECPTTKYHVNVIRSKIDYCETS